MNTATATDAPAKSAEPKFTPKTRLAAVYFDGSVSFGSEMASASVGGTGSNVVDSIFPGHIADDGQIVLGSEGATGLVMRKKRHDLHNGKRSIDQCWVPWARIRNVGYGE